MGNLLHRKETYGSHANDMRMAEREESDLSLRWAHRSFLFRSPGPTYVKVMENLSHTKETYDKIFQMS